MHPIRGGSTNNLELRWDLFRSLADALRTLKEQAALNSRAQWVSGDSELDRIPFA